MTLSGYSFEYLKEMKTIKDLQKLKALDLPQQKIFSEKFQMDSEKLTEEFQSEEVPSSFSSSDHYSENLVENSQ